ncbi:late embryogenesis abundant protein Lea5-D-like [Phoenix dactylifera]|uniref:Late embryogenesis abundant protein Lea5-D-like n=1 Tax=Phoenix dactylifera TaxID=42345 RepID=A0A8B7CV86_PHODC|nr:late embryogenesis abundant protein Lea5-D-like [Phoenix dactylifera]
MARALCSTAALAATLSDGITVLISRRGYAGAAAVTGTAANRGRSAEEKGTVVGSSSSSSSSDSWVPDPVTGYYRPGNRRAEVDAAELRETFLSHRSRH